MGPIRRILVAVKDPWATSLPAVRKAAQIAHATGAALELYHGISDAIYINTLVGAGLDGVSLEEAGRERYVARLEALAAPLRKRGLRVRTAAVWDYPVYEAIVRRASATEADLIIAERHATRHVAPWLLRFTDWELLRLSPVPVLLVKSPRAYRRPVILAALDPSHAFAKPSGLDGEILKQARAMNAALRGQLHAVHAYAPLAVSYLAAGQDAVSTFDKVEKHARVQAAAGLKRVLRGMRIPAARRHLVASHPIDAIHAVARSIDTAIVVMGAVSRSGLKRAFIGNTAERILDQLPCDVLVVKGPRFTSAVSRVGRGPRLVAGPITP
jgi:universal stress protein E